MNTINKLLVVVAIHKPYEFVQNDCYLPIQVGASGATEHLGFQCDDQGENISEKNTLYCELTALYWAWKNLQTDALGLVHYRRYFGYPSRYRPWVNRWERIAKGDELIQLLKNTPILVPKKRNYFIESREDQYVHAHGEKGMDALRSVLKCRCPQYLPAFERSMKKTSGHCFNMFVMRRDLCDAYCSWLFGVLHEVEELMRKAAPDAITPRLFGFLSERILDCWIETNGYQYAELPVVYLEKQNWLKKGTAFLMRKCHGANQR